MCKIYSYNEILGFDFVSVKAKTDVKDKSEQTRVQQWSYFQWKELGDIKHSQSMAKVTVTISLPSVTAEFIIYRKGIR